MFCCPSPEDGDNLEKMEAKIVGPDDSPFSGGVFKLDIQIPEGYPMTPPHGTKLLTNFIKAH